MNKYYKIYMNRKIKDSALIWDELQNFSFIRFWVIHNYINIAVCGVFFFCLTELTHDSPFDPNTAPPSPLLIDASYLSRLSINISVYTSVRMEASFCAHTDTEFQNITSVLHHNKQTGCQNSLKNDGIVVNWGCVGASMSSEGPILFLQIVHQEESFSMSYCCRTTPGTYSQQLFGLL